MTPDRSTIGRTSRKRGNRAEVAVANYLRQIEQRQETT